MNILITLPETLGRLALMPNADKGGRIIIISSLVRVLFEMFIENRDWINFSLKIRGAIQGRMLCLSSYIAASTSMAIY